MRYRQQVKRRIDARTNGNFAMISVHLASLQGKILPPVGNEHNHNYKGPNQYSPYILYRENKHYLKKTNPFPNNYQIFSNF